MKSFDKLTAFFKANKDISALKYLNKRESLELYRNEPQPKNEPTPKDEKTFAIGFSASDDEESNETDKQNKQAKR